jgi:hypothetical protein
MEESGKKEASAAEMEEMAVRRRLVGRRLGQVGMEEQARAGASDSRV